VVLFPAGKTELPFLSYSMQSMELFFVGIEMEGLETKRAPPRWAEAASGGGPGGEVPSTAPRRSKVRFAPFLFTIKTSARSLAPPLPQKVPFISAKPLQARAFNAD